MGWGGCLLEQPRREVGKSHGRIEQVAGDHDPVHLCLPFLDHVLSIGRIWRQVKAGKAVSDQWLRSVLRQLGLEVLEALHVGVDPVDRAFIGAGEGHAIQVSREIHAMGAAEVAELDEEGFGRLVHDRLLGSDQSPYGLCFA